MIQLLYMTGFNLTLRRSVVSVDNGNWGLESPPRWDRWIQLRLSTLSFYANGIWGLDDIGHYICADFALVWWKNSEKFAVFLKV